MSVIEEFVAALPTVDIALVAIVAIVIGPIALVVIHLNSNKGPRKDG